MPEPRSRRHRAPDDTDLTQPALKEWSAAVHALLDGRQTVLLRKGGIHEKRFAVTASRFLLFPTVAHSHAERVRPEHRDLLDSAAADCAPEAIVLRAGAKVVAAVEVEPTRGARRDCAAAYLDRRVGPCRQAGLSAQAPPHCAGRAGLSAGRAATAGAHAGLCRMHQLGPTTGEPGVGGTGARRRHAAGRSPTGSVAQSVDGS